MDQVALLRSRHYRRPCATRSSGYAMMTGVPHQPMNRENANPGAPNDWPTMGAVCPTPEGTADRRITLPRCVCRCTSLIRISPSGRGKTLGFLVPRPIRGCSAREPNSPNFRVPEIQLKDDVTIARLDGRKNLLKQLDDRLTLHRSNRRIPCVLRAKETGIGSARQSEYRDRHGSES